MSSAYGGCYFIGRYLLPIRRLWPEIVVGDGENMSDLGAFADGMRAHRLGEHEQAFRALSPLVNRKGLSGRLARYYAGMSQRALGAEALRLGRFALAEGHFRQAVALIGRRADLAEFLQLVYARTGQHERCEAEADAAAAAGPHEPGARIRLAQAQWRGGRRAMGCMTLTAALRELGDDAEMHLNLGLFYAVEGDYVQAGRHFRKAVECDCTCARAHYYLGLAEAAAGDAARSVEAFGRAWSLDPANLLYAYQVSVAAGAAEQAGRKVTVHLPESAPAPSMSEIRQLAEYVAREPDLVEAFLALPPTEADAELFGVVVSLLRTALVYHDDYADLHHLTGRALERLGELEMALGHARRAVEINPRYARALVHLSELEAQMGNSTGAIDAMSRAVACGADWPDTHARLGDLLRTAGDHPAAEQHYMRALQIKEGYARAAEGLASLAA